MLLQNNIVKVRFCWKYSNLTSKELSIQYLVTAIKSFSLKLNLNLFYIINGTSLDLFITLTIFQFEKNRHIIILLSNDELKYKFNNIK